jgi:hypothetical protein
MKKLPVKLVNGLVQNNHKEFVICRITDEFHFFFICTNTNVTIKKRFDNL